MKTPKLVMIEWLDSAQPVSGWSWLGDQPFNTVVRCQSVGWLITDTKEVKALAPNRGCVGEESEQVSGVIRIPAISIVKMTRLSSAR